MQKQVVQSSDVRSGRVHAVKTPYYMEYIKYATFQDKSKVFLSADVLLGGGGSSGIGRNTFFLGRCVLFGGQF